MKEKILSPTFLIVKSYDIPLGKSAFERFFHIDCYRVEKQKELLDLGWKDILKDPAHVVLVEWPERVSAILPREYVRIQFVSQGASSRTLDVNGA